MSHSINASVLFVQSLFVILFSSAPGRAQNVAPVIITPNGSATVAPQAIRLSCRAPGASIHVTTDGSEPTERDVEIGGDGSILLDTPAVVKARAFLADGRSSAVASAKFDLQAVKGNGAAYLDQDVPSIMAAGGSYRVAVSFRNIGTTQWAKDGYQLAPARASKWTWISGRAAIEAVTETWGEAEFSFVVTAPSEPGSYNTAWRVEPIAGAPFGEASPTKRIQVVDPNADPDGDGVPNWVELALGLKIDSADSDRDGTADGAEDFDHDGKPDATEMLSVGANPPHSKIPTLSPKIEEANFEKRLVEALKSGDRTYQQLRGMGFQYSDAQFDAFLKAHPKTFVAIRSAREEKGAQRALPGAQSIRVNLNPSVAKIADLEAVERIRYALRGSGHSFRHLRAIGLEYSDEDFAVLIAANPKIFRSARIIRRDETGTRIIPGWPAIAMIAQKPEAVKK